ncbi:beta-ketoacyl-ACP synthase II [bacterium]|nr:beta-ketoacyl-ACP synthase II [bacterium]
MKQRVVITGIGVVSPLGEGKDEFWKALLSKKSGVGHVSFFDVSQYNSHLDAEVKNFQPESYIEKKKIKRMDRFAQFAFSAGKMAIEDAQLNMEEEDPYQVGVIIGSGMGGLQTIENEHNVILSKGPRRVSPFLIPKIITNIAPGEIAIAYGLKGPNFSLSSACASSSHSIGESMRYIRHGDADVIIAGGSDAAITPLGFAGFCSLKALSTRNDAPQKASRPFDARRDGFIMGEGAGMIVMESLEHAQKRGAYIYAELVGYRATDDAFHITAPDSSAEASSEAMKLALKDGGIDPREVDYINAHGTSTPLNDKTETLAIKKVFGDYAYKIPISSTKSMTGHLLGAAGAVELIACILSIRDEIIHPTVNYEFPDPDCDLDYVPNESRSKKVRVALSNSLGFGGHNASLVLKKYEK